MKSALEKLRCLSAGGAKKFNKSVIMVGQVGFGSNIAQNHSSSP